ncbi:MAG: GC-type dockerin domain-anchored protein [Phycisphaerales bacterium JB040]
MSQARTARALASVAGCALAGAALAQTDVTWDGDCGFAWEGFCSGGTLSSWDNDQLPQQTDKAIIVSAPEVRITSPSGQVISELSLVDSTLNGVLNVLASATISGSSFSGRLESLGPINFNADSTFGGTMRGPGVFTNLGDLFYRDGNIGDDVRTVELDNFGTLTLAFEPSIGENSTLTNFGTLNFDNNTGVAGLGLLENAGSLEQNNTGEVFIGTPFKQSDGTTSVLSGAIRFVNTSELSGGTMHAGIGANLNFAAINRELLFNGMTEVSGQGTALFNAGAIIGVNIAQPLTVNMTAPGRAIISNNIVINAALTNRGDATVTNTRWIGSGEYVNEAGATTTLPFSSTGQLGSEIDITNRGTWIGLGSMGGLNSAFPTFTNEGTWELPSGYASDMFVENNATLNRREAGGIPAQNATLRTPNQTNGTINLEDAHTVFRFDANWSGSSELNVTAPATAAFDQGFLVIDGDTTINATGPGESAEGSVTIFNPSGSTQRFIVNGTLTLNGTETFTDNFYAEQRIRLNGTIIGQGTTTNVGYLSTLANAVIGDPAFPGTFVNTGRLYTNGGLTVGHTLNNPGYVDQAGGVSIQDPAEVNNSGQWVLRAFSGINGNSTRFFNNTGDLYALWDRTDSQGTCVISAPFSNEGTVHVESGIVLTITDCLQIQGDTLAGGAWVVRPGATLDFSQFQLSKVGPGATVTGGTASIPSCESMSSVEGTVRASETINLLGGVQIEGGGSITVADGPILITPESLNNGTPPPSEPDDPAQSILSEVRSTQQIDTTIDPAIDPAPQPISTPAACPTTPHYTAQSFNNYAVINPGPDGEIHAMMIEADTVLHPTSNLKIDLAGTTPCVEHDRLVISGPLASGGSVTVRFAPGYEPGPNDTFTVVIADSIQGEAPVVISPSYATNKRLAARIVGNTIELGPSCAADFNADGVLDTGDIGAFIDAFLATDPVADFNSDAVLDLGDISAFVSAFLAGC